jgi:hypothetical protein
LGLGQSTASVPNDRSSELAFPVYWSGNYSITLMQENGTRGDLVLDGVELTPASSTGNRWGYNVGMASGEPHILEVRSDLLYGAVVRSGQGSADAGNSSSEYTRLSNTEYRVRASASQPTWLLLSESYSPLWKAYIGDEELEHVQMDSVVNGYLVPAGENMTITIRYSGQETYEGIVAEMVLFTIAGTALMATWVFAPSWRGIRNRLGGGKR